MSHLSFLLRLLLLLHYAAIRIYPGHGRLRCLAMPYRSICRRRICPGPYLALLEMKMAMATLLLNFEIQSVSTPDGKPARELLKFTMTPVGLKMQLVARQM
jgi:hypothetical protein